MIINATNIGKELNGLGQYSLYLAKYIVNNRDDLQVYINENALVHFTKEEQVKLSVVNKRLSPDYGFRGHLLRLLWASKYIKQPIFNTSQLELSLFNKNQIVTVHDIIPLHFPEFHKKQYHFFKYILPIILKNIASIITVSNHTKDKLIEYYNLDSKQINVIYNGIKHISYKKIEKEDYILYVGRASETKNIRRLIQSFCRAKQEYNIKEKLYLVGVREEDVDIKCNDIVFYGYVQDQDLQLLYQKAKIFFFPSLYEGFGYPVLEAMQFGTPVLTSDISSLPEVCSNTVMYTDPYDIDDMVLKLNKLLSDEKLQKELIEKGLKRASEFSWEKSVKEHMKVIDEVLKI